MVIKIILYALLGFICIYGLVLAVKFQKGKAILVKSFSEGNCLIFGPKGAGKDLLNNKVINARKQNCYANIPYNRDYCTVKSIKDFSVEPNTFENILNNNIKEVKKINKEECDFYISDAGIVLPSQYSQSLIKEYPSLPIYYALSRQLTNSNIHCNTQYIGRVWDKIREQAEYFFRALHTTKLSIKIKRNGYVKEYGFLITDFIFYDSYESAAAKMRPFNNKKLFAGKEGAAMKADFEAKHGIVKQYKIIQRISHVYYDSRHFHTEFYGYKSPDSYN